MTIFEVIKTDLEKRWDVEVNQVDPRIDTLTVSIGDDDYTVEVEAIDVDDEDRGQGRAMLAGDYKAPATIKDHVGILDMCLHALRNSEHAEKIDDLTTDGDGSDCEAIFEHSDEGDMIIRVR